MRTWLTTLLIYVTLSTTLNCELTPERVDKLTRIVKLYPIQKQIIAEQSNVIQAQSNAILYQNDIITAYELQIDMLIRKEKRSRFKYLTLGTGGGFFVALVINYFSNRKE